MTSEKKLCEEPLIIGQRVNNDSLPIKHSDRRLEQERIVAAMRHEADMALQRRAPTCASCSLRKLDYESQADIANNVTNLRLIAKCGAGYSVCRKNLDEAEDELPYTAAGILGAAASPYRSKSEEITLGPGSLSLNGLTIGKTSGVTLNVLNTTGPTFDKDALRTALLGDPLGRVDKKTPWPGAPAAGSRFVDGKTGTEWEFIDGKWEAVMMKKEAIKSQPKDIPGDTGVDPW